MAFRCKGSEMATSVCTPNSARYHPSREGWRIKLKTLLGLRSVAIMVAAGVIVPILVIVGSIFNPDTQTWKHIVETLLGELLKNTFVLSVGVLIVTFVLGTGSAWLTAVCDFPGRAVFNWALILPLAIPTYVLAFTYIGLLDFSGPVQSFLRSYGAGSMRWFPDIRSAGGVILVLSLALYPYVYLLARNAFQTQGKRLLEASQALGHRPVHAFFKVALPMARPWIAGGLMLVLMETLADFGAVSIFNFDTLTTGIYKAWFGLFSLSAAAQLSSLLLAFVFLIIIIEQQMRQRMQFHQVGSTSSEAGRMKLQGWKKFAACGLLSALLLVAFIIPCIQLVVWSMGALTVELDSQYFGLLLRSLLFSTMAASLIVGIGLLMAYIQRQYPDPFTLWTTRLSTMGYALPGTVLAVGIVIMVTTADKPLIWFFNSVLGLEVNAVINNTILAVLFAYVVRFLTAGFNSINSSMLRITRSLDEAAGLMGVTGMKLLLRLHAPILKNGLLTAAMLVFVDVMKEMPMTLMTRPFGWDTLAVKIFELTSEGEWQRAALPSITLVLAGLIPLILLNRKAEKAAL